MYKGGATPRAVSLSLASDSGRPLPFRANCDLSLDRFLHSRDLVEESGALQFGKLGQFFLRRHHQTRIGHRPPRPSNVPSKFLSPDGILLLAAVFTIAIGGRLQAVAQKIYGSLSASSHLLPQRYGAGDLRLGANCRSSQRSDRLIGEFSASHSQGVPPVHFQLLGRVPQATDCCAL